MRTLRERGIGAGVFLSPILPGLTDDDEHLEAVVAAAAAHGAEFLFSQPLRLGPGITEYYVPFIEREFPHLLPRYERLYRRNSPPGLYSEEVQRRVRELKRRYGLEGRRIPAKERPSAPVQLEMFAPAAS
jgi:DNA repair photolyase